MSDDDGGRERSPLWLQLGVFAVAALVLLVGLAAFIVPRTEVARENARAERFQQWVLEVAERQEARLSLRP